MLVLDKTAESVRSAPVLAAISFNTAESDDDDVPMLRTESADDVLTSVLGKIAESVRGAPVPAPISFNMSESDDDNVPMLSNIPM